VDITGNQCRGIASSAWRSGNLCYLTHGAAMVCPSDGFDPLVTLETVGSERCTAIRRVPTMFIGEMHHPDFSKFEFVLTAHRYHPAARARKGLAPLATFKQGNPVYDY